MFVQDDYAVLNRFTLNLGVRYEFITLPREEEDRVVSFRNVMDPTTTVGYPMFKNPSLGNVAPRIGFAWDVFGDGRTSVHGGGGLFYEPILGHIYRNAGNRMPPFFMQANTRNPPFPNPFAGTLTPQNQLEVIEFELENPARVQYNLTVEREILPQTVVRLGYVGARGYNQLRAIEANQAIPEILPGGGYFFPAGQSRRNPVIGSMRWRATDGNSWYNSVLVGVNKRFTDGLQFQAAYTFARATDEASRGLTTDLSNSIAPRYAYDRRDNFGVSDYDLTHNFVFNYSYELPLGRNQTGLKGAFLQGWQVSGIYSVRSGLPFTPVLGFDRARALPRSGGDGQRPNWAPGFDADNVILGDIERYFDPNAFLLPDAGYFGDVERNALRGPKFSQWDAAFFKNIRFGERHRVQLRFECFNVLNTVNLGLPARTVFNSAGRVEGAGEITGSASRARQLQLGVKWEF
jgi:hypothetical protein